MTAFLAVVLQLTQAMVLENDFVRVSRDSTPCASASTADCGDRVIVALSPLGIRAKESRALARGDIAVFGPGESYEVVGSGSFVEVAIKGHHPPAQAPDTRIPPEKNMVLYDGDTFFVFEERLAVGDTRPRHSHSQRVVIQLNRTRLRQWPDGEPEIERDIQPDRVGFNPPVVHRVLNTGDLPLRGIVIEFKPERP